MRFSAKLFFVPVVALVGCGEASGNVLGASNDLHCSVISSYFSMFADQSGAPADQRRGAAAIREWYAAKLRQISTDRGGPDLVMDEMAPVLAAVKRDPKASLDEYQACSDRAFDDPEFDRFVGAFR